MERHYNLTIATDGRPALSNDELRKAIVAAINKKDPEAERYGLGLTGYQIIINPKKQS
jgi:hypothetical protein